MGLFSRITELRILRAMAKSNGGLYFVLFLRHVTVIIHMPATRMDE
mgnify:CR=1 FL=1